MTYEEALKYISSTYKFGSKLGLENITKLTELLQNPQEKYKIIHVAGTNGKGSTCNMIHDVLVEGGYKVGLFISPFLQEFTERIQINKKQIDKESLANITSLVKQKVDIMMQEGYNHPTEFEIVTAIGFKYFEEQNVDFLVLEVGLGGRFDATNCIKSPLVSVIASISLDHTQYLGNTLEQIAFEKAGIIKENSNVVIYPQKKCITDVIKKQAKDKNAKVYETDINNIEILSSSIEGQILSYRATNIFNLDNFKIKLLGEHQAYNCLTVIKVLEILKLQGYNINETTIIKGLQKCTFAGRFEIIQKNPVVLIDGGHNIDGVKSFCETIKKYFNNKKVILFYGMLKDKHPDLVADYLINISKEIYTLTPNYPSRAMASSELKEILDKRNNNNINITALKSLNNITKIINNCSSDEIIACVGSLYLIGDLRTILYKNL